MAWIHLIEPDDAGAELAEIYARRGQSVPEVVKAGCWNVPALAAREGLFKALMYPKEGLQRAERELIAVVTSAANQCHY